VDVVRHQTIGVQCALHLRQQAAEVKKIKLAILIGAKARLAVVATVDNVHRNTRKHETRATRHGRTNEWQAAIVDQKRGLSLI
jgi:ribosomal protein L23